MNQKQAELKEQYLEYYADLPVQKYACMSIGKNESTIHRWKEKDASFANRINQARANWVKKRAGKVRAEFALERLEKEIWGQQEEKENKINVFQLILNKYGITGEGLIDEFREHKEVSRPQEIENGTSKE